MVQLGGGRKGPAKKEEGQALLESDEGSSDNEDYEAAWRSQELVGRQSRRSKRAIAVAVAVGALVLVLVVVGAVLLSGTPPGLPQADRSVDAEDVLDSKLAAASFNGSWVSGAGGKAASFPSVTFQEVVENRFGAEDSFNGTWLTDTEFLYRDERGQALLYDVTTMTPRVILKRASLIPRSTIKLEISADQKYLLAAYNYSKLFRHTYLAQYDIIDIENEQRMTIENSEGLADNKILQLVVWAPVGNAFAYVYHNNIVYRSSASSSEEIKLTSDGHFSTIYHGIPDWVYEEEVLSSNTAMWFSPDGKKLAYASFNDSRTRVMSIPYYGAPTVLEFQYPRAITLRYPKPGTPNPTVLLSVVQLENEPKGARLLPPQTLREPILSTVTWANNEDVAAIWMNRVQNEGELIICNAMTSNCNMTYSLRETEGWLDIFVPPLFSKDGQRMVFIYPHDQGLEVGAFRHVTLLQREPLKLVSLTAGTFVVTEILGWDEDLKLVYFLGTDEKDPSILHLYSVSDDLNSAPNKHVCISCNYKTSATNKPCLYNKAAFSKESSYYVHSCNGPDVPEINIYDKNHKKLITWEDNQEVRDLLQNRTLPDIHYMEVDVPGGFKAQVQVLIPPNIDTSGKTKYPLLVNVYGGPDSYQVTKRFSIDWSTYLTVNRSIIHAAIDGRGSGLKGNKMLFAGYRKLGSVEIDDQVNVTRYLQNRFNYIDKNRTGIWGWSYGGYSTGMALAKDKQGVFKCGISVAPVTDWAYYDTIYTERYMGLPTSNDNLEGYVESDLNNKLENFRHKMFFLVHGTLDDNVHYQQSMMLSKVLEHNDILFRQQSYPDEEHGLAGVRPHLYHSLEDFLEECFNLK